MKLKCIRDWILTLLGWGYLVLPPGTRCPAGAPNCLLGCAPVWSRRFFLWSLKSGYLWHPCFWARIKPYRLFIRNVLCFTVYQVLQLAVSYCLASRGRFEGLTTLGRMSKIVRLVGIFFFCDLFKFMGVAVEIFFCKFSVTAVVDFIGVVVFFLKRSHSGQVWSFVHSTIHFLLCRRTMTVPPLLRRGDYMRAVTSS